MKDLLEFINSKTNNAYKNTKLVGVVHNKETQKVCFRFVYHDMIFTQKDKDIILALIEEFYKHTIAVEVKAKKDYIDEEVIADYTYQYILNNHTSFHNDIKKSDIKVVLGDNVQIKLHVFSTIFDYLKNKDFENNLKKYLEGISFATYHIELVKDEGEKLYQNALSESEIVTQKMIETEYVGRKPSKFQVTNIQKIIGEDLESTALDVGSIKSAIQKCQIAGKIKFFTTRTFTSKRKDEKGNYPEKTYYSWSLFYQNNSLQCVYFPTKNDVEKITELVEDMSVIVGGDVEEYNGRINFKVKSISKCDLPEIKEEVVPERKVNENYIYVKPEPYITEKQFNFFDVPKEPNDFLKQNDVVVFDVETTGLDYRECEIIEIGAVKLHEGEIVESFSCFARPKKPIPEEITNLTGITNDMVKDAHSISEVIVDFYKFCYGCVIVAYNIDFDYKFINAAGTKVGYKFTNRQLDALYLARQNVVGAKNFTLKSICARLGVSLDGAHRAINDATATAEVLKLISDNVSPN